MNIIKTLFKKYRAAYSMFFLMLLLCVFTVKANADACDPINTAPVIYQINRSGTQATLFFTPINDQLVSYTIAYGFNAGDARYNITFNPGASTGAISYTTNSLQPNVQYFYEVRSNTTCTFSPWSSWIGDKGGKNIAISTPKSSIPVTGSNTLLTGVMLSFGAALFGLFLFVVAI